MAERTERPAPRELPVPPPVLGKQNGLGAWLGYLGSRAAIVTLSRSPAPLRRAAVEVLARVGKAIDGRRRQAARTFLTQALGEMPAAELEARVLQAWRHVLNVTLETERMARRIARRDFGEAHAHHFEFDLCPDARELLERGAGTVIVVPHLGCWELLSAGWRPLTNAPLYVVGKAAHNRPLSRFLQERRERFGVRMVLRDGAMKTVRTVLELGGTVGMLLDQRARKRALMVPFFGRPAPTDRSAAVLLKRLGVPVQVMACLQTGEDLRFRIRAPKVLWPEDLRELSPEEIMAEINRVQERMILEHPEQYFWLHDRYRPPSGTA